MLLIEMGNGICFDKVKIGDDIKKQMNLGENPDEVSLQLIEKNDSISGYKKYLEEMNYVEDFFVIADNRTLNDLSFLFVDMYTDETFRCNINMLWDPVANFTVGQIPFCNYCRDGVYYGLPSSGYIGPLPRKQLYF
jgi:uncharacterized protein DUF6924